MIGERDAQINEVWRCPMYVWGGWVLVGFGAKTEKCHVENVAQKRTFSTQLAIGTVSYDRKKSNHVQNKSN